MPNAVPPPPASPSAELVYLNGQFVPRSQACISVDDAGFQHAVGLFETMAASHGQIFRLAQHLARLATSARQLGLVPELHPQPLAQAVQETLARNQLSEARIRLTLTAGPVSLLRPSPQAGAGHAQGENPGSGPTLLIVATPPTQYDPVYFERGITVLIAPPGANPFDQLAGHKTLAYWGRLRALRQAAAAGAGEVIWLNVTNHLASGAISNLFLVKGGKLLTPIARGEETSGALAAPVLPGVTRAAVLEIAQARSIPVERRMLTVTDLLDADEVFLTNSSWHLLPVTQVEKKPIATGQPGPLTHDLRTALLALIDQETA